MMMTRLVRRTAPAAESAASRRSILPATTSGAALRSAAARGYGPRSLSADHSSGSGSPSSMNGSSSMTQPSPSTPPAPPAPSAPLRSKLTSSITWNWDGWKEVMPQLLFFAARRVINRSRSTEECTWQLQATDSRGWQVQLPQESRSLGACRQVATATAKWSRASTSTLTFGLTSAISAVRGDTSVMRCPAAFSTMPKGLPATAPTIRSDD